MSTTESPFSLNVRMGNGQLTVRGDTLGELTSRTMELAASAEALEAITDLGSAFGQVAPAVTAVKDSVGGNTSVQEVSFERGAPEEMTDKYGAVFTYNLAEAPKLEDGRDGFYVKKVWTDAKGKARKAWVDPIKGPKPFPKAASGQEAPIVWL